jgi:hypothetical protein
MPPHHFNKTIFLFHFSGRTSRMCCVTVDVVHSVYWPETPVFNSESRDLNRGPLDKIVVADSQLIFNKKTNFCAHSLKLVLTNVVCQKLFCKTYFAKLFAAWESMWQSFWHSVSQCLKTLVRISVQKEKNGHGWLHTILL